MLPKLISDRFGYPRDVLPEDGDLVTVRSHIPCLAFAVRLSSLNNGDVYFLGLRLRT